jgi:hypothetical protein
MRHNLQLILGISVSEGRAISGGGLDVNGGGVMLVKRGRRVIARARGRWWVTGDVSEGILEVCDSYCHDLS